MNQIPTNQDKKYADGFTLIELLIVLALISVVGYFVYQKYFSFETSHSQKYSSSETSYYENNTQKRTDNYEQKLRETLNKSVKGWTIVKGKWEIRGQAIKYVGAEDEANPYGMLINENQRIWQGFIETTVNLKGEAGAHVIFSYHPVQKFYFTAGIGRISNQVGSAFILTELQNGAYNTLSSFGKREENLVENSEYKVKTLIEDNRVSLIVNGIKVISQQLPHMTYSDRVGLFVYGTEPVEFKNFKVNSTEP